MTKNFQRSLFIFRRDLRLHDNLGLIAALEHSEKVIPAFILTPEQINDNPYKGDPCLQFMLESLEDLQQQLQEKGGKLYLFEGRPEEIVERAIKDLKIEAVFVNRDYTPYSIQRDKKIEKVCKRLEVAFESFDDALLHPPEDTLKKDGKPYTIFTPYFRNAVKFPVAIPQPCERKNYYESDISFAKKSLLLEKKDLSSMFKGGRKQALRVLNQLNRLKEYGTLRDFPALDYSTHLSPYLKFNLCSVREAYWTIFNSLGTQHELIRSLFWRDFFTSIAYFFPHVFGGAFHREYDALEWSADENAFKRWCEGKTGFPIVDAGMRELNQTGFMHNRVRMIVASFLVKDLHIDWRWGERYFALHLVDYDPCVNNGNWQWSASTGCDAQPYFRIFNPWTQQQKFDPDAIYIKKWVKELQEAPVKMIHEWADAELYSKVYNYPVPMLRHEIESKAALQMYKAVKENL